MPANGLTQRSIERMSARHFRDVVSVDKWTGKVDEVDQWANVIVCNGKFMDKSGTTFKADGANQAYDCTVICVSKVRFADNNQRYRISVSETYTEQELQGQEDGMPVLKNQRFLYVKSSQSQKDNLGNDVFQVVRCENAGDTW